MTAMPSAICVNFARTVHQIKLRTVNDGARLDLKNAFVTAYVEKVFVYPANQSVKIQSKT